MELHELPTTDDWGTYDWTQAFELGAPVTAGGVAVETFPHLTPESIQEVVHFGVDPGSCSEVDFYTVLRLNDGRYASGEAGCDTTGWGCQGDYAWWKIAATYEEAVAELSAKYRQRIKVEDARRLDN